MAPQASLVGAFFIMVTSGSKTGAATVLIVGAGNMGGAFAKGLGKASAKGNATLRFETRLHDVHQERLQALATATGALAVPDLAVPGALTGLDAVILCVKPQDLAAIAAKLNGAIDARTVVISILAGVPMDDVRVALGFDGTIVRAMPNIAATVGAAATAMCENGQASAAQKALVEGIFGAIGEADWTKEALLDAVTGLSGSGPAYLYMVIEALTDGGVKMGIPRVMAQRLSTQTVLGAAMLVKSSGLHPAILRDQVTTPGGTTISAIHELEERGLRAMLISAVETATARAAHLRKK